MPLMMLALALVCCCCVLSPLQEERDFSMISEEISLPRADLLELEEERVSSHTALVGLQYA